MKGRVSHRDLAVFFRSFSLLFRAGVSLDKALILLAAQSEAPHLADACSSVAHALRRGVSLSQALGRFPNAFPELHLAMIRVAEESGGLPVVLERIAVHEEKAHSTFLQVRGALVYPICVLTACLLFVLVIPPWLSRELFGVLDRSGVELPLLTRAVLAFSAALHNPVTLAAAAGLLLLGATLASRALRQPRYRLALWETLMELWGLGPALKALATARFSRSLEVALVAGVPLDLALRLAAKATGNPVLDRAAPRAVEALLDGASLPGCLSELGFFPAPFLMALEVGCETGQPSVMVAKVAQMYELELEHRAGLLISTLEPLVILFMGVTVGVTVIATMVPLMRLLDSF